MGFKRIMLMLAAILMLLTVAGAQEIKKSTKTEYIGGKHYYLHTVEKGQTVSAIAKAYGIPEEDIYEANPDARKVIKVAAVLKIPVKSSVSATPLIHTVLAGETLTQIAQHYKVKMEDLLKANPGLSPNNIKPGQLITIPGEGGSTASLGKSTIIIHVVQKDETLFSIARKYGVTVDELKVNNPGLNETIHIGQQIRVPVKAEESKTPDKPKDTIIFKCMETGMLASYNVGLLLPLYLERAVYIDTSDSEKTMKQYSSFAFIGFYEGFLMALDSVKQLGLSVNLYVDDVVEDSLKTLDVIKKQEYSNLNLLIGPFFSKAFQLVAPWAKEKQIKTVNPFTSHSSFVCDNPYVFKNVASAETQARQCIDYARNTWPGCNIFILHTGAESDQEDIDAYIRVLGSDSTKKDYFVINYAKDGLSAASKNMAADRVNVVISYVHGEANISNFIRNMSELSFKFPLTVFGLKEWEIYSSLEAEYLLNINLHMQSYSFIDYSRQPVREFVLEYRRRYKTEPDEYAFAGYDIGIYFLNALRLYGTDFQNCLGEYKQETLCMPFQYGRLDNGGFENTLSTIYRYEDFKQINALETPKTDIEINKKSPY
jgi:LysM repeat protein/ABC-type branched-subunit amino acid transport system substrate-binding protein